MPRPIRPSAVAALREQLRGRLVSPDDTRYDAARKVWNGRIDRRPSLIAFCADEKEVVVALRFAREHELLVAVRGGGHSCAGTAVCDDGLVIDLSLMKAIEVDAAARSAQAQGGVLWGELDRATQAFGLAVPGGTDSEVGIAGLTLGGGNGWLMGVHGATCDNLLSADVVMADSRTVTANCNKNADLFWALRGGGGNFGIVTSFLMVPELLIAIVLVPTSELMRNASLTEVMRAPALLLSVKLRTVEPPEVSSARTVALIVPKLLMTTPGAGEGPLHPIAVSTDHTGWLGM